MRPSVWRTVRIPDRPSICTPVRPRAHSPARPCVRPCDSEFQAFSDVLLSFTFLAAASASYLSSIRWAEPGKVHVLRDWPYGNCWLGNVIMILNADPLLTTRNLQVMVSRPLGSLFCLDRALLPASEPWTCGRMCRRTDGCANERAGVWDMS